jgi:hypothetical protein
MTEIHHILQGEQRASILSVEPSDGKTGMRRLISFLVTLLMPLILIGGGGALTGWGITNEWATVAWIGAAMVVAGVLWGLFLFLWAESGPF